MSEEKRKSLGVDENNPTEWFENLYSGTTVEGGGVPWANMEPHPCFKAWLSENKLDGTGKKALVVGCGMGDDAIALEALGFEVVAFDVSSSAIDLCKKRFGGSSIEFVTADLLEGIPSWKEKFDFVLEIFTIQALPPKYESQLINNIADMVAKGGELLVVTEVQSAERDFQNGPPWVLNEGYIKAFEDLGLENTYLLRGKESKMGEEIHTAVFKKGK